MTEQGVVIEPATLAHLDALLQLKTQCFATDRLSCRSMRRFLTCEQSVFLVALMHGQCVGYVLVIFHRGTRLARLYSIAVGPMWQDRGIARRLMKLSEAEAQRRGALYFRLEVNNVNEKAISLYQSLGFKKIRAAA